MPIIDQLINGHRFDFSSIKLTVLTPAPQFFTQVTAINYEYSRDIGILRGIGSKKLGRTRGQFDASGSLTMYVEEWNRLKRALALSPLPLGGGFMEKSFNITVAYAEAPPAIGSLDTLEGCTITRVGRGFSQGADALMVDLDFDIMDIVDGELRPMRDRSDLGI